MAFGEQLKQARKERNLSQEDLAEKLGVSRQSVSKWESGTGYPETEKLITLSKLLEISLDNLLLDETPASPKGQQEHITVCSGKIAIPSFDRNAVIQCQSVKCSDIAFPGKDEPRFVLNGIDKVSFWGEHATTLGWYATKDDIQKEMEAINQAICNGLPSYELQYCAKVQCRNFGFPKIIP